MVTVSSAISTGPSVFPLIQCGLGTGDTVTLGCFATGFTPSALTYAWKNNGAALTEFIQYPPVQKGNVYTGISQIRVKRQDWEAKQPFECEVKHASGTERCNFIKQEEFYRVPTLKVLASSDKESEASFSCFANDFSPKDHEIKWLKNNVAVTNKVYEIKTPPTERTDKNGTKLYSAASFLTVQSSEWTDNNEFTCQFEGKGKDVQTNETVIHTNLKCPIYEGCPCADVEVKIIAPSMEDMFLHKKGTVTCQVKVNKPSVEKISWETENGGSIIGASPILPARGQKGVFSALLPITYDEWSGGTKFLCIVENEDWILPLKKNYERIIGGQTQRPSVFMLPPLEDTRKETMTLSCYVKDFYPQEVFVAWLVDDVEADSNYEFHTTNPVENHGSYSAYGQLSLSLKEWNNDNTVYNCVVYHESVVNSTKAIVRSIGQKTCGRTNMVNLNMNMPEKCKAQ